VELSNQAEAMTIVLHQTMVFDVNEEGRVRRSFGVHTDIGYLKMDGKPTLSFIGFDDEPSYHDVKFGEELIPMREKLSRREKGDPDSYHGWSTE
jgi:hypothetical protein